MRGFPGFPGSVRDFSWKKKQKKKKNRTVKKTGKKTGKHDNLWKVGKNRKKGPVGTVHFFSVFKLCQNR